MPGSGTSIEHLLLFRVESSIRDRAPPRWGIVIDILDTGDGAVRAHAHGRLRAALFALQEGSYEGADRLRG